MTEKDSLGLEKELDEELLAEESKLDEDLFRLFIQLNDFEPGMMVNRKQIDKLLECNKDIAGHIDKAFEANQRLNQLDFDAFKNFMKDIEMTESADEMEELLYKKYFQSNVCKKCLACFCYSDCRKKRVQMISDKQCEYEDMQNSIQTEDKPNGLKAMVEVYKGISQLLDLYTDIAVLATMYYLSMQPENRKYVTDYQTALVVSFVSIASVFLTQQGCLISIKFSRGDYELQNFRRKNCLIKLFQVGLLTCAGAIFLVLFEVIDHLNKVLQFPALIIGGSNGVQKVNKQFLKIKNWLSSLNDYQLISLEQQRSVAGLIFENLPQTILLFAIKMQLLNCTQLVNGQASLMINISLAMTMILILQVTLTSWMEARSLKESATGYLMSKMTANNRWIPFIHFMIKRDCPMNVHYGQIDVQIPLLTKGLGIQKKIKFEFMDWTLNYLLDELILWSSEMNGQSMKQKYKLIMTQESLSKVTANMLVHFVHHMPQNTFELQLLIDWQEYFQDQEEQKIIQYTYNEANQIQIAHSPKGVSLLNICILNEKSSNDWPLKEMFELILGSGKYVIQDQGMNDPLVVAIHNDCFQSIKLLNQTDSKFDLQMTDSDGISVIGYTFTKLIKLDISTLNNMQYNENLTEEQDALRAFTNDILMEKINMHKKQFANVGVFKKPISGWQIIFKSLRHHRRVRFGIKRLLEQAKEAKDFDLNEEEKNTLFKSTAKLLTNFDRNAQHALKELGQLCNLCKVNMFTFKDKNERGLDFRMMMQWPEIIKDNQYLNLIHPEDWPRTNLIAKIFELSISQDSLKYLFEGTWQATLTVLNIDENNGSTLQQLELDDQSIKRIDQMLSFAKNSMKESYSILLGLIKKKLPDYQIVEERTQQTQNNDTDKVSSIVQKGFKRQMTIDSKRSFKFTKRFREKGNLKRNVGKQIQQELQFQELSQEILDNIGGEFDKDKNAKIKVLGSIMRNLLETTLEWIATADLYTDLIVLIQLAQTEHRAWTTITIFSMVAPFLACQIPFLNFLKELIYRDLQERSKLLFLGRIMLTPFMIVYMFLMDIVFLVIQAFLFPLLSIIKFITCGYINFTPLIDKLDQIYEIMFEMQKLDVAGFRRMRTITQLTFETYLQLALQLRMLFYFQNKSGDELGVSVSAIAISLMLSTSHALIEAFFLYMEAQASKTSFLNYCIICFNGRFGWVPFNDHLIRSQQSQIESSDKINGQTDENSEQSKRFEAVQLDFENITSQVLCFNMEVEFSFTNDTLLSLSKTLSSFPLVEKRKNMPKIRFGATINQVSLSTLQGLLKVCQNRVYIDLHGTDLIKIYKNSPQKLLLEYKNIEVMQKNDLDYLFQLQESKQNQLLKFILIQNDLLLKAKSSDKQLTLANIAYENRDEQLLELLFTLESKTFQEQLFNWEDSKDSPGKKQQYVLKLVNTLDMNIWTIIATNSTISATIWDYYSYSYFDGKQERDPSLFHRSLKFWHSRYGPRIPPETVSDFNFWGKNTGRDFMQSVSHMYPAKIYVRVNKEYTTVETCAAYCFATIRKKLVEAWEINSNGPKIDKDHSEGVEKRPLNIGDLGVSLSDFKILTMLLSDKEFKEVQSLTDQDVQRLDECICKLKLDSYKWLYIGRTRLNDQTGNQIECIYHGKDVDSVNPNNRSGAYMNIDFPYICSHVAVNFDPDGDYYNFPIAIQMPKKSSFYIKFHFKQDNPNQKSYLLVDCATKEARYHMWMYHWGAKGELTCEADPVEFAEDNTQGRLAKFKNFKPMYMLDSQQKGCTLEFSTATNDQGGSILRKPIFTFVYDYPPGVDLDQEQIELEKICAESFRIWQDSPKI